MSPEQPDNLREKSKQELEAELAQLEAELVGSVPPEEVEKLQVPVEPQRNETSNPMDGVPVENRKESERLTAEIVELKRKIEEKKAEIGRLESTKPIDGKGAKKARKELGVLQRGKKKLMQERNRLGWGGEKKEPEQAQETQKPKESETVAPATQRGEGEAKGEIPEPAPGGRKITEEQERALLDRDFDPTTLAGLSADEADRQIADFDRKYGAAPAGGSRETEPAAKIEDKTTPAEKTEAKRAAAIAGLREVIANAQRKLEENRIERARLRERLQEIEEGGRREEADSPERERRETIEQDKKRNPFKYFLIDKMSDEVFKIIFGKGKGEVSLEEINRILGESGREVTYWNFNIISPETYNAVHHSSNGFSLQIQNPGEVTEEKEGKRVTMIDDPKAKYKLVSPDGTSEGNAPTYQEGYTLMEQKAGDYQARQIDEFDSEAELKELETIPTKEEKIRFLERKRKERIMNLKEVKRWIQIATEGTKSEHEGRRERSARELETLNSSPVKFFLDEVEFFKKNTSDNARESEAWYQTVVDEINVINARYDALIANLG